MQNSNAKAPRAGAEDRLGVQVIARAAEFCARWRAGVAG